MARLTTEGVRPSVIILVADEARRGVADPDDVRALLQHVCDLFDARAPIPYELHRFLRDSFREFLGPPRETPKGKRWRRSLEGALGLAKKRSQPPASESERIDMAAHVLHLRLKGESHQDALENTGKHFGRQKTVIGEAWSAHWGHAVANLSAQRRHENGDLYPWSDAEIKTLRTMLPDIPWTAEERERLLKVVPPDEF